MKKLFTLLALLTALVSFSQPVKIYFVNPGILCPGDTITIQFIWDQSPGTTHFIIQTSTINQIHSEPNVNFYSLPKTLVGIDTVYTFKLQTHPSLPLGSAVISTDFVNTVPIYFFCDETGIEEFELDKSTPIYRNGMTGEIIEAPVPNMFIIEQRGRYYKKYITQKAD